MTLIILEAYHIIPPGFRFVYLVAMEANGCPEGRVPT